MPDYYSTTYPAGWTEAERKAAEAALSPEEAKRLRQEWETPLDFWRAVDAVYWFETDVCASPHNAKCGRWFEREEDALSKAWVDPESRRDFAAWCNPGFSNVLPWHQKAYEEAQRHANAVVVVIGLPGASAAWYKFACTYASEIIDLGSRVNFLAPWPLKQTTNNRESVLYVYRRKPVPTSTPARYVWDWRKALEEAG